VTAQRVPWEHGSDQPLVAVDELLPAGGGTAMPWAPEGLSTSTGRDAVTLLLQFGRAELGWRRVWLPSYYCQSVVRSIVATGLDVAVYPSRPGLADHGLVSLPAGPGDVLVTLGHFGLCRTPVPPPDVRASVVLVEDHSHDPWSPGAVESGADYCFASLRKTLPLPDGAVLWSPLRRPIPPPPARTAERMTASLQRLQAMAVKAAYLAGCGGGKQTYRALFASAEVWSRGGAPSAAAPYTTELLGRLPIQSWRRRRQENHASFLAALAALPGDGQVRALDSDATGTAPCLCVAVMASGARRDTVRAGLADRGVYAATHWSLDEPAVAGLSQADRDLSARIITLQCDARYDGDDMRAAARLLNEAAVEAGR